MTNLISLLPAEGWTRLMCDAIWQSTLIALIAWIVARYVVRQPAARAWLLVVMLAACVMVPLASAVCRATGWSVLTSQPTATPPESIASSLVETDAVALSAIGNAEQVHPATPHQAPMNQTRWTTWTYPLIGGAWLLLSCVLAARLGLSMLALHRLKRRAIACTDPSLLTALREAAKRIGLAESPALLRSDATRTPVVQCLMRPWLCIPAPASIPGDKVDWPALFSHELAHIVRRDGWTRLFGELVTIVLPLQPMVWVLRRELYRACEEACDDWALACGSDPDSFAAMLTAWLETGGAGAAAGAMGVSSTKSRILRLLTLREIPRARLSRGWRWAAASIAVLIVAGIAAVQTPAAGEPPGSNDATKEAAATAPYVIEPPDVLSIKVLRLSPKEPTRVAPLQTVSINVDGTLIDWPIAGDFQVDSAGEVVLGPAYGAVKIKGMTRREAEKAVQDHLREVLENPRVSLVINEPLLNTGIEGKHPVGPDGRINLGGYGTVSVAGKTITEVRQAIEQHLSKSFEDPKVAVDVAAYNSKVYYVIVKHDPQSTIKRDSVHIRKWTGNKTVMDAIVELFAGSSVANTTHIQIRRPSAAAPGKEQIIELKWDDILQGRDPAANPRLLPQDRIFISSADDHPPRESP